MKKEPIPRLITLATGLWMGLYPAWGWAAEGAADWRPTYDTVMMWVNFVILVVLLVKFLRPPAKKFLHTYKADLASENDKLTSQKQQIENELAAFKESLQERRQHWEKRYQRILAQGERDHQALIAEARDQAQRLMENADRQIEARVRDAGRQLQSEIVDNAIAVALQELPQKMTPEIEQRWFKHFLNGITKTPPPEKK